MLTPETVLQSRYRVLRQLGQGGMGAVYEAMDERLDAVVALKETLFADERLRKQFEREARLLARMHHPALPRVSDHFGEGDGQFLVMQYIEGDDLAQMMTLKRGPFPPEQVLTWGDQLLDALDYLHTQDPQIIHRDIKPQNLKLTARGQIILLDFGLAKGQSSEVSPAAVTSASIFGYTPNYAPLEQIQGLGTDARSDIYALSATLYHLMTFVKPPSALTRAAALVNGEPDPLRPANEINSSVSPAVASVLARAMSQNRERRFDTASKMRKALTDALAGISDATLASAETTIMNTAVPPVRGEAATVLFESAPATLQNPDPVSRARVRQTAIVSGQTGETTVQRKPVLERKRSVAPWAIGAGALCLIAIIFGGLYAYQTRNNSAAVPNNSTAPESTPTPDSATVPAAGPVPEETKAEASKPRVQEEVARKKPSTEEPAEKAAETQAERPLDFGGVKVLRRENTGEAQDPQLTPPVANAPEVPRMGGRRNVPLAGSTRSLPDGTQVVTQPDGTRVLILPNGTTRIFRPGERLPRRRRLP
jgi:serine/threonine protein kinase